MKNKKYVASLIVVLVLSLALGLLSLSGCSKEEETSAGGRDTQPVSQAQESKDGEETPAASQREEGGAGDRLAQIQEKGEIVIAMEGTWSPWTYHDENDELVGFDVEVAKKIAQKLGVEAVFVEGEFDGLLAGFDAGRYDLVINGVSVDEERREKYDFSDPYAYDRIAVIVAGDNEAIQAMEDLNGKKTANTLNSVYAKVAEEYGAKVTGVNDLNQTFELLLSGRIDATLNAEVSYYDYMKSHPDAGIKIAVLNDEATEIAIPVQKGEDSASLLAAVNEVLSEMKTSGELSELSLKYFGSDITKAEP